ncbi:MAG: FAD-dependent oxidoreductase [Longimonas sp.]|uniref:FAD-dependent oxidoreductase n=1 Tax=Longimonas sp. TaxID=2039626 RepID=UPI0039750262
MHRRDFIRMLGAGATGLSVMPYVSGPYFQGTPHTETDIVIFGGGAGGLCAGLQAARLGAEVVILEPSPWVGGMITAAGVSALDGNKHGAGGGLVHTFREELVAHYGSYDALETGWISLYNYEPHVGQAILDRWVSSEDNLTVLHGVAATGYERTAQHRRRISITPVDDCYLPANCQESERTLTCRIFIDATEYGDGLPLAGIPYRLGRESRDEYGEVPAPAEPDMHMQDLTYAATLVRDPEGTPLPVADTDRARWDFFACSTTADCENPDSDYLGHDVHSWERFITYAALPNDKYLLNWPHHANDYPVSEAFFEDPFYRKKQLRMAKQHTIQFLRYMQTELDHPEWQLATDEYPTEDHLPPIPYIRESRRMVNNSVMTLEDVVPTHDNPRAPIQPDAIAVGDYFIDHHHARHHLPPDCRLNEDYPDNAPFQVPASVFVPDIEDPCVLVGEKSIAVTHIVNGCTRLQPVVMLMGQALGVMAAHAVHDDCAPADVSTGRIQHDLIDAGCPLYIVYDITPDHDLFEPVQRLAQAGILRDDDPTELDPDAPLPASWAARWCDRADLSEAIAAPGADQPLRYNDVRAPLLNALNEDSDVVSRADFVAALHTVTNAE